MYTSVIDKYWIFDDQKGAIKFFRDMAKNYLKSMNLDDSEKKQILKSLRKLKTAYHNEIFNIDHFNYIVLTEFDNNGYGRRP